VSLGFVRGCVWVRRCLVVCVFRVWRFSSFVLCVGVLFVVSVCVCFAWLCVWSCGVCVGFGVWLFAVLCVVFMLGCVWVFVPWFCQSCLRLCVGLGCVSVCAVVCRFVRVFAESVWDLIFNLSAHFQSSKIYIMFMVHQEDATLRNEVDIWLSGNAEWRLMCLNVLRSGNNNRRRVTDRKVTDVRMRCVAWTGIKF
jgi:hypothetical protein